tara:strand:- start:8395 stop:9549 length:1155 start_codon:yes stop_codon:yes gene_type:complete
MSDDKIDDLASYNNMGADDFDLSLPEIPVPEAAPPEKVIEDKFDGAFKFAFVGAGQGGSRIAETFHKFGYARVCAINTAQQDLNTVDIEHKLCIGSGGAGKDMDLAAKLFSEKKEDAFDLMREAFGDEIDRIFVCAGAGGGSGAGTTCSLIDSALQYQDIAQIDGPKKVGVVLALPKVSEGKKVNANAFQLLHRVLGMVQEGKVSPLILIDNEKISKLYPKLPVGPFWETANKSIVGLFHLFNITAAKDSSYSSFDPNDYRQILNSGCILYGASPVSDWTKPTSISKTVRDNLKQNLLCGGFDLESGSCAGVVVVGGVNVLNQVPQENLDKAFEQFSRILKPGNTVHRGIYSGNKDNLIVYTAIGGLGIPHDKLQELKRNGDIN